MNDVVPKTAYKESEEICNGVEMATKKKTKPKKRRKRVTFYGRDKNGKRTKVSFLAKK